MFKLPYLWPKYEIWIVKTVILNKSWLLCLFRQNRHTQFLSKHTGSISWVFFLLECEICSSNPINTEVLPCRHRFSCSLCIDRVKKCFICKELITDKLTIPDLCFICDEMRPTVTYHPCGCLICCSGCSKLTKKCPKVSHYFFSWVFFS